MVESLREFVAVDPAPRVGENYRVCAQAVVVRRVRPCSTTLKTPVQILYQCWEAQEGGWELDLLYRLVLREDLDLQRQQWELTADQKRRHLKVPWGNSYPRQRVCVLVSPAVKRRQDLVDWYRMQQHLGLQLEIRHCLGFGVRRAVGRDGATHPTMIALPDCAASDLLHLGLPRPTVAVRSFAGPAG